MESGAFALSQRTVEQPRVLHAASPSGRTALSTLRVRPTVAEAGTVVEAGRGAPPALHRTWILTARPNGGIAVMDQRQNDLGARNVAALLALQAIAANRRATATRSAKTA